METITHLHSHLRAIRSDMNPEKESSSSRGLIYQQCCVRKGKMHRKREIPDKIGDVCGTLVG